MELAEQVDPEEWHRILDRFFQILTDGVHRFEGTINSGAGQYALELDGARRRIQEASIRCHRDVTPTCRGRLEKEPCEASANGLTCITPLRRGCG